MKKGCLIGIIAVFCSILVVLVVVRIIYRDKTVFEHVIDDSYRVRIRTIGSWEGYIDVYLEIDSKEGNTLRSNRFTSYSPEQVESRKLGLEIRKAENIIFLYKSEDPHTILVIVSFEDNLIYPRRAGYDPEEKKAYYARVRKLFSELKKFLNNEDLYLYGLSPQTQNTTDER